MNLKKIGFSKKDWRMSSGVFFLFTLHLLVSCRDKASPPTDASYPTVEIKQAIDLPDHVHETSGMLFHQGTLWTHNDSGDNAIMYRLDLECGQVLQELRLPIETMDWEDVAADSNYLYVADFGNNMRMRRDLRIFKFPLDILSPAKSAIPLPDTISFYYPEQKKFSRSHSHNFDAEALLSIGNHILILTKNRADQRSFVYKIPKASGHHAAEVIDTLETQGLITAAVSTEDNVLLLGYNFGGTNSPFLMSYRRSKQSIDWTQATRWNIAIDRQTEAIGVDQGGNIWISAEKGRAKKATLFQLQP